MSRGKPGTLLPLEAEILETALAMLRSGQADFHGFGLAHAMREQAGSRALTSHGTLYKALGRLEEFGLLTSRWEDAEAAEGRPRRRLYELSTRGAEVAEQARASRGLERALRRRTAPANHAEAGGEPDVHDHIAHERRRGTRDRRIAIGIASRVAGSGLLVIGTVAVTLRTATRSA